MDVLHIFHQYRDDVYRLAVSYTRSPQEAEDVCQNVFLKLMETESLIPGKEKAWLMQVAANECRDLMRSAWWKRTVPLENALQIPGGETDETIRVLGKLKPKYRVILYLHYYEQYTTAEIAGMLGIPAGTVCTRLSRGREQLRKLLGEG